jgi:Rieske Fe-S protein
MNRRVFLAGGLALAGFVRRAWAQLASPSPPVRYAPLIRPVTIPASAVTNPWQPVPFVAEARAESRRVLISGVLFRTQTQLSALCVTCPHEQCQVDLVTDPARLARMAPRLGSGQAGETAHPVFECGCHASVFDAADEGARLSGETPRGLYRFRIGGVRDGIVEIPEIEEVALSEV